MTPGRRTLGVLVGLSLVGVGLAQGQDERVLAGSWDRIPVHQTRPQTEFMEILYLERPCPYAAVPYYQTMHLVMSRIRGVGCWKPTSGDRYMTVFSDGAYQLSTHTLTETFQLATVHPESGTFTILQKDGAI